MSYIEDIQSFSPLSLNEVIKTAKKYVPNQYKRMPWAYPGLDHGVAILDSEEQLCCYLAAYGEMHKGKLACAFEKFPFNQIDRSIEIIDWGCGQGLASLYMIDKLRYHNKSNKLQKVTLIEPSSAALSRAKLHIQQAVSEDVFIETLNCYLPATNPTEQLDVIGGLHIEEPICVHLFSNILDIPSIDLKELAYLVGSSGYIHYFICVGPANFGNDRLAAFPKYFNINKNNVFIDFKSGQYKQLENGKWYSCVAKGFQLIREEGKPFLVPLSYYPPKQFHGAYQLDVIEELNKNKKGVQRQWMDKSAFEVLAPFDIGASIYEDIDPILAVISNIMGRGLPTNCTPYIEEELNKAFDFSEEVEEYGTIRYGKKDDGALKEEILLRDIPIGIARIQKVIVEAVLTGHISILDEEWNVVVKENDIPCAALAFKDLEMMYNHLTAMSVEYRNRLFPKVNLHIISEKFETCPIHLGNKVYSSTKKINKEFIYDMVIDFALHENIDAANVQFSEFKAKNDCYFNVRSSLVDYSAREIYTTDRIVYLPVTTLNSNGGHDVFPETAAHLVYFLRLLFRKKDFRPGQLPILNRALQIKGVIGLLPTGGGKSLTYQLAAMLQPGVTVVIDPLKSLMQDQYDGLISTGIDCCTYINGELGPDERAAHERMMEFSQVVFTFMSPERLCIYEFRERLQNMEDLHVYFSYGVIDEVHCVSEWGQDFRFSYLHLGRNLYSYVKAKGGPISLFGLTATASFDVLSDVERELTGNGAFTLDPDTIIRYENSNRLELQYKVERIEVEYNADRSYNPTAGSMLANYPRAVNIGDTFSVNDQKSEFLSTYIQKIPAYIRELQTKDSIQRILDRFQEREDLEQLDGDGLFVDMPDDFYKPNATYEQSGIVFCPHVNSTGISVSVNSQRLSSVCDVGTFSGSDQDGAIQGNESMENMKRFRDNKLPLMVATKAFGMGIDKPNVRFTVNMNYSSSLESFVQEAGRAGRDRKMALSIILLSDYNLIRVSDRCKVVKYPMSDIKNKWFKEADLREILDGCNLHVDESDFDRCNPLTDIVRLKCNTDNTRNAEGNEVTNKDGEPIKQYWKCTQQCSRFKTCSLRHVDKNLQRKWVFIKDLNDYLSYNHIRVPKENLEYQGADYNTVMFFFDNNFKGEFEEKKKMNYLLSEVDLEYFYGNDKKDKPSEHIKAKGFLEVVLSSPVGTEIVSIISYAQESYADIAKAIYRMCIIGLIDDFTQDYRSSTFRILTTRKKNGSYYERLKEFLMRYYTEERAENEVEKASVRKGKNEIHKCLGYLTEFIYDKVALKRKRAIDDIRNFCLIGIDNSKDWKEINEDLKDEIYYYFNSKYAREGYRADNDEPFSLLDDTERGKNSSFDILYKYMRVVDNKVIGTSGSPKDNIKHLQGAVRLIRRAIPEINPTLSLLNVFCLQVLKVGSNRNMANQLDESYIEGYLAFKKQTSNQDDFFDGIKKFKELLNAHGRNLASDEDLRHFEELEIQAELQGHLEWIENFTNMYIN